MFHYKASWLPQNMRYFEPVFLCIFISSQITAEVTITDLNKQKFFRREKLALHLTKHHLSQREARILNEAAEFAIRSLGKKKTTLKRILNFEKSTGQSSAVTYKLHVLFQSDNGLLQDKHFDLYVINTPAGRTRFNLKKKHGRERRESRLKRKVTCNKTSKAANCSRCGYRGVCARGAVKISPWLQFALKTQREIQMDESINRVQFLGSHNAFNNRASGYGIFDDCDWPLKDQGVCISLANQEFSFTDQLNMGVRHLEIDLWGCFGAIHMSHGDDDFKILSCFPWDEKFTDGIREISEWQKMSRNMNEIIQIYLDDHTTFKNDGEINQSIQRYFGDTVFTPKDKEMKFAGKWPTMKEMRRLNKTLILVDLNQSHRGRYFHESFWTKAFTVNAYESHLKTCSSPEENSTDTTRVYSDSTYYGPFYNGIKDTGMITDFKKYLLCGINIPSADQINPELMSTAVFTWAPSEPKQPITDASCVILSSDTRWYVANCDEKHHFACISKADENNWMLSSDKKKYSEPICPPDTKFSIPHNGFQHQKLVETAKGRIVWLNLSPYIPFLKSEI